MCGVQEPGGGAPTPMPSNLISTLLEGLHLQGAPVGPPPEDSRSGLSGLGLDRPEPRRDAPEQGREQEGGPKAAVLDAWGALPHGASSPRGDSSDPDRPGPDSQHPLRAAHGEPHPIPAPLPSRLPSVACQRLPAHAREEHGEASHRALPNTTAADLNPGVASIYPGDPFTEPLCRRFSHATHESRQP